MQILTKSVAKPIYFNLILSGAEYRIICNFIKTLYISLLAVRQSYKHTDITDLNCK